VIGFLGTGSPGALQELLAAFHRGLGEMGYIEGQNIKIEYRFAPKASTTDYRRWRLS
jgi:putative tryptophan/tyrosine transport system substrate-binding protein